MFLGRGPSFISDFPRGLHPLPIPPFSFVLPCPLTSKFTHSEEAARFADSPWCLPQTYGSPRLLGSLGAASCGHLVAEPGTASPSESGSAGDGLHVPSHCSSPRKQGTSRLPRLPAAHVSRKGQKSEKAVALATPLAAVTQLVCSILLPSEPAVPPGSSEPQTGRAWGDSSHPCPP